MRKFVVHTRALPGCAKAGEAPLLVEVEGEVISAVEDPSVMWLPKGEYKFRILKPESLYEPKEVPGAKDKMVPPIYCSWTLFSIAHEARAKAYAMITHWFESNERKQKVAYTHEEVMARCDAVQEVLLP